MTEETFLKANSIYNEIVNCQYQIDEINKILISNKERGYVKIDLDLFISDYLKRIPFDILVPHFESMREVYEDQMEKLKTELSELKC